MVNKIKSKWGEGTGGASEFTIDANKPSYDPAENEDATDKKIRDLCEPAIYNLLSTWERKMLLDCYGNRPLRREQHVDIWKIYKKYIEEASNKKSEL